MFSNDSMLSYISETHLSRKFNVKLRYFPGTKTDMFHYFLALLRKIPDYVILHVGTNDVIDNQSNDVSKSLNWKNSFS